MNFNNCVDEYVDPINSTHKNAGHEWWEQLGDKATDHGPASNYSALKRNIESSRLFPEDYTIGGDIRKFCEVLSSSLIDDPINLAKEAIEQSKTMIIKGPFSNSLESQPCSLLGISSFGYYCTGSSRGPLTPIMVDIIWDGLSDVSRYNSFIDPTCFLRGSLPHRFWASKNEVDNITGGNPLKGSRLAQFLGLSWSGRSLLVSIKTGKEPTFSVPTGWDGFDNDYFRENDGYNFSDPNTHFGYTLDLKTGTKGAKEVVSKPIILADTELCGRYE